MRTYEPVVLAVRLRMLALSIATMSVAVLATALPARAVTIPGNAFRYVHDANGRLVAASDPSTDTAVFGWDPVGNLTSIARHATSSLKIIQLAQTRGAVGDSVVIDGTGFSTTLSSNVVKVNGTTATVTAAAARSLTFKIPAGATTGTVSVTTGGVTVTSAQTLTVKSVTPTLSGVSPTLASPGDTVTLTGTNLNPAKANNTVKTGKALATVTAATATSVQATVPAGTGSGAVSVTTPYGSATGPDLFIPPGSLPKTSIGPTARLAQGTAKTMTFSTAGKVGLALIAGQAGQELLLSITNSTLTGASISILDPGGQTIMTTNIGGADNTIDNIKLPEAGTYTAEIIPSSGTGSLTLKSYVSSPVLATLAPTAAGATKSLSLTVPGQTARYSVSAQAGDTVAVNWQSSTIAAGGFWWIAPDGSQIATGALTTGSGFLREVRFPTAGTYTLLVNPDGTNVGNVNFTAYKSTDITGTVTPSTSGSTKTASLTIPGQRARYTVAGLAGQQLSFRWQSSTISQWTFQVLRPDGYPLTTMSASTGSGFVEQVQLPADGTYTLLIDPDAAATGSVSLITYNAADLVGSITPSGAGAPSTVGLTVPGQNARMSLSGTAGQRLSFSVTSAPDWGGLILYNPSGYAIASAGYSTSGGLLTTDPLSATGTYTLVVDPYGPTTGSVSLTSYTMVDVADTLVPTPAGATKSLALPAPGQVARYTVAASAGQRASIAWQNSTIANWDLSWYDPNGWLLTGYGSTSATTGFADGVTFPTSGDYTLLVDPNGSSTGTMALTAYDASDATGTITPSALGDTKSIPMSAPGQNGRLTFSGITGQTVSFAVNSAPGPGAMVLLNPSGGMVAYTGYDIANGIIDSATLSSTGTYTLLLDPNGSGTGTVNLTGYLGGLPPGHTLKARGPALPRRAPDVDGLFGTPRSVNLGASRSALATRSGFDKKRARQTDRFTLRRLVKRNPRVRTLQTFLMGNRVTPSRHAGAVPTRQRLPRGTRNTSRIDRRGIWLPGAKSRRSGGSWHTGLSSSRQPYRPLQAAPGITGLSGRALRVDGSPLPGVQVSLEGTGVKVRTDRTGRFLLAEAPSGRHTLIVESSPVDQRYGRYGTFSVRVDLVRGATTDLGFTLWMSKLDPAGDAQVSSPTTREEILTTPRIPGLEVRLPAGTVIKDAGGKIVRNLNLTQVPVDRPPFPLPSFISVPTYFNVQPGRAYLSKGAQIIYPNFSHLPAGQRVNFWNYDAHDRGWYIYGHGTVTRDAKQIKPDPNVRIWEFTGAMINSTPAPPGRGPKPGPGNKNGGDPVDLGTGLFVHEESDLGLSDTMPVTVDRVYRPGDPNAYSFGVGTAAAWDIRLWSIHNWQDASLVLPNGAQVKFVRTSPGTDFVDAIYTATEIAGGYEGATIAWNGNGWDLRRRDGVTYVFGSHAGLQAIRDRFGNTTTFVRPVSQADNVAQITSPNGRWVKFTYDSSNRITKANDIAGRVVNYSYDASGRLQTVTDPAGRSTTYGYNTADQMTSITNGRGVTYLQNTYDANGRVATQALAGGGSFTFSYALDSAGTVSSTTVTDPRGSQSKTSFDASGLPIEEVRALGTGLEQTWTAIRQGATGRVTSITDPRGRQTSYQYDTSGNVTAVTEMAGTASARTKTYTYGSPYSALTSFTDQLGHTTTLARGAHGELTTTTDPLGHVTTRAYRADGQLLSITTPLGKVTTFGYASGVPSSTSDPLNRTTSWFTDSAGRRTFVRAPDGQTSTVEFNDDDEPTKIVDPAGQQTVLGYDAAGNRTSVTDPNGHATTFTYDSRNRVTAETDALNAARSTTYDGNGNITQQTDRKGQVKTYAYDALDRLTTLKYGVVGSTADSTVSYSYDSGDRVTQIADSATGTSTPTFDDLDRLTSLASPQGTVSYTYDKADRRTGMTATGVTSTDYVYDDAGRLTGISRGPQSVSVGYDSDDRVITRGLPNGVTGTYAYDDASQVSSITYKKGASVVGDLSYAYDNEGATAATWGSLARLTLPAAASSFAYNAANERTAQGATTLAYDANGNLTSDGTSTNTWNSRDQLVSSSGSSASFSYDTFGRRTDKTINGTAVAYLYDGLDAVKETSGGATTTMLNGLGVDQHLARTTSAGTESYLVDLLGSTVALADGSGAMGTSYTYGPFGAASSTGNASANPYQFTGRETDGAQLQYSRARYYNAASSRFLSRDPLGVAGSGNNLYDYVRGDPLSRVDPTGMVDDGPSLSDQGWAFVGGFLNGATGGLLAGGPVPDSLADAYAAGGVGAALAGQIPGYGSALGVVGLVGAAVHLGMEASNDAGLNAVVSLHGTIWDSASDALKSTNPRVSAGFKAAAGLAAIWSAADAYRKRAKH